MPFDFTAILNDWGINLKMIMVALGITLIILTLSLREFFYWFLRTHDIAKKQNEILNRLSKIESLLDKETVGGQTKKFTLAPVVSKVDSIEPKIDSDIKAEPLLKKLH